MKATSKILCMSVLVMTVSTPTMAQVGTAPTQQQTQFAMLACNAATNTAPALTAQQKAAFINPCINYVKTYAITQAIADAKANAAKMQYLASGQLPTPPAQAPQPPTTPNPTPTPPTPAPQPPAPQPPVPQPPAPQPPTPAPPAPVPPTPVPPAQGPAVDNPLCTQVQNKDLTAPTTHTCGSGAYADWPNQCHSDAVGSQPADQRCYKCKEGYIYDKTKQDRCVKKPNTPTTPTPGNPGTPPATPPTPSWPNTPICGNNAVEDVPNNISPAGVNTYCASKSKTYCWNDKVSSGKPSCEKIPNMPGEKSATCTLKCQAGLNAVFCSDNPDKDPNKAGEKCKIVAGDCQSAAKACAVSVPGTPPAPAKTVGQLCSKVNVKKFVTPNPWVEYTCP